MDDLEIAKQLFGEAGLAFPVIPTDFAPQFQQRGKGCFSSRVLEVSPYDLDFYLREVAKQTHSDYVILAHTGHGVNSYAIQYYLVCGPVRFFLFLGWGGVYMDKAESAATIRDCFVLTEKILNEAGRFFRKHAGCQLQVVASDFYRSYWHLEGDTTHQPKLSDVSPIIVLSDCLAWLCEQEK